jgi:hypothetical protein
MKNEGKNKTADGFDKLTTGAAEKRRKKRGAERREKGSFAVLRLRSVTAKSR